MIALNKLIPEDIDQKIRLNEKDGLDIFRLRDLIKEELKDFQWVALRAQVQCQCYVEQLEHIEKRIKEFEANGDRAWAKIHSSISPTEAIKNGI